MDARPSGAKEARSPGRAQNPSAGAKEAVAGSSTRTATRREGREVAGPRPESLGRREGSEVAGPSTRTRDAARRKGGRGTAHTRSAQEARPRNGGALAARARRDVFWTERVWRALAWSLAPEESSALIPRRLRRAAREVYFGPSAIVPFARPGSSRL